MSAKSKTQIKSDRALHSKLPIPVSKKKLMNLQSNLNIKNIFVSSTPVRKKETKTSKNKFDSPILATSTHDLSRCSVSPINKSTLNEDAETISKPSVSSGFKKIITGSSSLFEDEDDIFPNSKNKKRKLNINTRKTSKIIKEDINSNVDKVVFDKKIKANASLKDVVKKNLRSSTKLIKDLQQTEDNLPTSISSSKNMNLIKNTTNNASNKKNIKTITKTVLQNPVNKNGKLQNNNRRRRSAINSSTIIQVESEQIRTNKKREANHVKLKKNNSSSAKNIEIQEKNQENIEQMNNVNVVNKKENLRSGTKRKSSKKDVPPRKALESASSKKISFNKNNLRNPTDNLKVVRRSTRTKYYAKQYWIVNSVLRPKQ